MPITFVAEAAKPATAADSKATSKSNNQKSTYTLGASLGRYMKNSPEEQEKLSIKLNKDQLIADVQDALADKSRFSDQEIEQTLQAFETRIEFSAQVEMERDVADNEARGRKYCEKSAKEKNVKTFPTGLAYQMVETGKDGAPEGSDTVIVNYKGTLIDGKGFGNSYTRGESLSLHLDGVIPGWTESLKDIKKGGGVKLVIPSELVYGKVGVPGIPPNLILVFNVELLGVKLMPKADTKSGAGARVANSAEK